MNNAKNKTLTKFFCLIFFPEPHSELNYTNSSQFCDLSLIITKLLFKTFWASAFTKQILINIKFVTFWNEGIVEDQLLLYFIML